MKVHLNSKNRYLVPYALICAYGLFALASPPQSGTGESEDLSGLTASTTAANATRAGTPADPASISTTTPIKP